MMTETSGALIDSSFAMASTVDLLPQPAMALASRKSGRPTHRKAWADNKLNQRQSKQDYPPQSEFGAMIE
jgi:hypothetical protein